MKRFLLIMALLNLLSISNSYARSGWFVGGGFGQSMYEEELRSAPELSHDTSDFGYKVFTGWDFNRIIGIETGFANLGSVFTSSIEFVGYPQPDTVSLNIDGFYADFIARIPLGRRVSLFGEVGLYRWSSSLDIATYIFPDDVEPFREKIEDNGFSVGLGVGLNLELNRKFNLAVLYERYDINDVVDLGSSLIELNAETAVVSMLFKIKF